MSGLLAKLRAGFAHAFSVAEEPLQEEDARFLDELAGRVAKRRLLVPAILGADLVKHTPGLHMAFFGLSPLVGPLARLLSLGILESAQELDRLVRLSERREHVETFIRKLEARAGP